MPDSLVDSYRSAAGQYGATNRGDQGTVQAGETIEQLGGIIHGQKIPNAPAGLATLSAPQNAKPLPLGASAPGRLWIHDRHDSITLSPGNYVAQDVDVRFPGEIKVFPAGLVSIFVRDRLLLDGEENRDGNPRYLQFAVSGKSDVVLGERDTFAGLLYAPSSNVIVRSRVFGSVVGGTVRFERHAEVHFDQSSDCTVAPPKTPAIPPDPLPAPPAKLGCHVYSPNGWNDVPCATAESLKNLPHPDAQIIVGTGEPTPLLVYGQLEVTLPAIQSEQDTFQTPWGDNPGCISSGNPVPNQFSIQNNPNQWLILTPGPLYDHTLWDQFTMQTFLYAGQYQTFVCIYQIDVTLNKYPATCVVPNVPLRPGGLQPFDAGNIAVTIQPGQPKIGTGAKTPQNPGQTIEATPNYISMVGAMTWVPSGQPNIYAVTVEDTNELAKNWQQVSGGILGAGGCSQAQFKTTEAVTQVAASTCPGDTQQNSPTCSGPALEGSANTGVGSNGTAETSNLIAVTPTGVPSLAFLNSDLLISNMTSTTSAGCLGPSHAYVKDSPQDFGAVPSTIGNAVFWESPDLFLVPHGTPVTLNAVSSETTITPGGSYDVWVRAHNDLGCSDVDNVTAEVYLADPSALSVQWDPITGGKFVGPNMSTTGVTVPAGGEALIGPLNFTAPAAVFGSGHKCMLAAIQGAGEAPPANTWNAPASNQVAQRNLEFGQTCEYPLTNATALSGTAQITLSVTPIVLSLASSDMPSLTGTPDVEVAFDDADSNWYNVWRAQTGAGSAFAVTHNSAANTTTVRLGTFSVALDPVPLPAGQSRNATGTVNPGIGTITLQIAATLTESGPGGQTLVSNGGSCTQSEPVIQ